MNKEIDIKLIHVNLECNYYLKIAYKYKYYKYLAADKYGNLFILDHCPDKRTIKFNMLSIFNNSKQKTIKYHGSNISFNQLKSCCYSADELYLIPSNHKLLTSKSPDKIN